MHMTRSDQLRGWRLTLWITLALLALCTATALLGTTPVDATRRVIRLSARTSFALFLLAFLAAPLFRLTQTAATAWLRTNRRYIGVGFAVSHLLHALALIALFQLDPALFDQLTTPASFAIGLPGYALILAMTATSFDRTARLIGPLAWARLHRLGTWYLWLAFSLSFLKRVPLHVLYLVPVLLLVTAALLRAHGHWRGRMPASQAN